MAGPEQIEDILAHSRPRLIGTLYRHLGDFSLAEDVWQEAALKAFTQWPEGGLPEHPEAWLLTVARHRAIDIFRREKRMVAFEEGDEWKLPTDDTDDEVLIYRDDILRLMFICSHESLSAEQQVLLALNAIAGFSSQILARAFMTSHAAMEKRLSRLKNTAFQAEVQWDAPFLDSRRQSAVKAMLYLMFNEGYGGVESEPALKNRICEQAINLIRLLNTLCPDRPETQGLLALCLFNHSRRDARWDGDGRLVSLDNQERKLWDQSMIAEAHALVQHALTRSQPGYYLLQACISGIHAAAVSPELTDWKEILLFYDLMELRYPSPVVSLNRSVALAHVAGAERALPLVTGLESRLKNYPYYYSTLGHLYQMKGDLNGAKSAFLLARKVVLNKNEIEFLDMEIDRIENASKQKKRKL
ncbi:hypothetical protein NF212_20825 [Parasalinivibrio latis]|uniref:RNA polymerase sigma factor n=1 Tax=Parasalinivibrio latis TaxID=2952610 RepID=UPI0030E02705